MTQPGFECRLLQLVANALAIFKVIPQKRNLPISVWKNTYQKIGHYACVIDMMSQTYPIYACTGTNHVNHFIGSQYILR